jgi:hypothetical protein
MFVAGRPAKSWFESRQMRKIFLSPPPLETSRLALGPTQPSVHWYRVLYCVVLYCVERIYLKAQMRYSGCGFMRSGNLSPCHVTFIPMGKIVLNCARSSGMHTLYKVRPHFILLFLEFVFCMLLWMVGVWTEAQQRRSELLGHVCSNLCLLCWMGLP